MDSTFSDRSKKIHVNARSFAGCADGYAAVMAPFFTISPMATDTPLDHNTANGWQTDRCLIGLGESNPYMRIRAKQEIQNSGHLIEITRALHGTEQGVAGDEVINRTPGPIYVLDQATPIQSVLSQIRFQRIFVPKAILSLPPGWLRKERVIEPSTRLGWVLHTCMNRLYESVSHDDGFVDNMLLDRFFALLKVNLGVHPERGDVRAHLRDALREQICDHIESRLGDQTLSASSILSSFGVSRSSLYRMFEEHGGVRNYVMQRRTVRAVIDISKAPEVRGQVRRASNRWGFSTQPSFNRTVRRVFGAPPGSLFPRDTSGTSHRIAAPHLLKRFSANTAPAA